MVIKGKYKQYEGDTLKGVAFDIFAALMGAIKPFKVMEQPARDEAIKEDWETIQAVIKPAPKLDKGKPKNEAPE
jgi:hypothetical protein